MRAANNTINSANQQVQGARYGVLANPQQSQQFTQSQTQGNSFNPVTTGARILGRTINDNVISPVANTAQIPFSAARLGVANLTGNTAAANNARTNFGNDIKTNLFSGNVPFEQSIASAINAPVANYYANREADRAERLLTPAYENLYRNYGYDPRIGANQAQVEAGRAKQDILNEPLRRAGIGQNESLGSVTRKVGAQGAQAGLNTVFTAQMGNGLVDTAKAILTKQGATQAEKTTAQKFLNYQKLASLNAAANIAGTATQDNATATDYLKSGVKGYATGLAIPIASEVALSAGLKGARVALKTGANSIKPVSADFNPEAEMARRRQILASNPDLMKQAQQLDALEAKHGTNSQLYAKLNDQFEANMAKSPSPALPGETPPPTSPSVKPTVKLKGKGSATPEEVTQYAASFNISEKQAAQDLIDIKARENAVQSRQQNQPGLGPVTSGIKERLNPTEALSQAERLDIGKPENNPLLNQVGVPKAKNAIEAHKNADYVTRQERYVGSVAQTELGRLSARDQELFKSIQTDGVDTAAAKAENPGQFKKAADAVRTYYDTRHAFDHHFGINTPYRQNYLRDLVERNQTGPTVSTGETPQPGYTMAKTQTGYSNVSEALAKDINQASYIHGQEAYARGLEEAYGAQNISRGQPTIGQGGAGAQIKTRYAGDTLFATKELAQQINKRAPNEQPGLLGRGYDKATKVGKTLAVGGNPFHGLTEAFRFVGQQVLSPSAWKHPIETFKGHSKVLAGTFSEHAASRARASYEADGTTQWSRIGGQTLGREQIAGDAASAWYDKARRLNPIRAIHESVFGREIPLQKQEIMKQAMGGSTDYTNPAMVEKARQVALATNHMFGGLDHATDALSPKAARRLARASFSGDFTESKFRLLQDALTKGFDNPQGNIARQAVVGKALAAAAPGIIALSVAGKIDWNNPKDVAEKVAGQILDPSLPTPFKTKSGIAKIARLPGTDVSEIARVIEPFFNGDPNKLSGLEHYAVGHVNPAISPLIKLATNQDYKGDPVIQRNPDGSLNIAKTAANLGGSSLTSIGTNSLKVKQGKQSVGEALVNAGGLRTVADPNSPEMKAFNFQTNTVKGLSKPDQQTWNQVYGANKDQYGNPINVTPALDSQDNATRLLTDLTTNGGKVVGAGKKINDFKASQGLPSDPFFNLSGDQQKTVLNLAIDKFRNPAERTVLKNQNKGWYDQYTNDRTAYFNSLNLPPSTKTKELPEPTPPSTANQYFGLTDPAKKGQYLADHPELTDYFNQHDQFIRAGRAKQGLPQYDKYPTADPNTQKLMDTYSALPKNEGHVKKDGTRASDTRSAWIQSHPKEWAAITGQWSKQSQYSLQQDAQQAAYEGQDLSDKGIKDIVNLAKDLGMSTGGGSGYGGFKPTDPTANPYKYAVSLRAGGSPPKAKAPVKVGSLRKVKVAMGGGTKPKVSIKKSLV